MRRIVLVASSVTFFAAAASSQDAQQFDGPPALRLMLCSKVTDGPARLKCFDEALAVLQKPVKEPETTPQAAESWDVSESKSPVDDSPQVLARLFADKAAGGIAFRCVER